MKMFKKLMAVVLTGALAVSMLTGCAVVDKANLLNALNRAGKTSSYADDGYTHKYTNADSITVEGTKYEMSAIATKVVNAVKAVETKKDSKTDSEGAVVNKVVADDNGNNYNVSIVVTPSSTSTDKWSALAGEANKVLEDSYCTGSSNPHEIKVCVRNTSTKKASGSDGKSYNVYVVVAYAGK